CVVLSRAADRMPCACARECPCYGLVFSPRVPRRRRRRPAGCPANSPTTRAMSGCRRPRRVLPRRNACSPHTPPTAQRAVIRRVTLTGDKKLVALTFDLCEQPSEISGYQGGIVDFLRANRIKATFFMGGKWMLSHRERTQQLMSDPLFEVANHTWEHRN